jgi:hypothetical protein
MTRRELLAATCEACASPSWARDRMDKSRISAITGEIGVSTEESIAFAHHYGLQFVEIRNRILNIQVKGEGGMPASPEKEDWKGIMTSLMRDGYPYKIGLETHLFDGTPIQAAHASMEEILRIVNEV